MKRTGASVNLRRAAMGAALALAFALVGCGSDEGDRPPPTIGGATVLERPDDTSATTTTVPLGPGGG